MPLSNRFVVFIRTREALVLESRVEFKCGGNKYQIYHARAVDFVNSVISKPRFLLIFFVHDFPIFYFFSVKKDLLFPISHRPVC